jgi:uncharacterized protein (TIGR02145 family)
MKKKSDFVLIVILGIAVLTANSCKKDPGIPILTTEPVSDITANTAVSGGNVISDEGAVVTVRGVCWGTSPNPSLTDFHTSEGSGPGRYVSLMTGLEAGTKYYVRAYALNNRGIAYGNEIIFETPPASLPELLTAVVSEIAYATAISGGSILDDGGAAVTSRGVCWGTKSNPTILENKTSDGTGTGNFTSNLTGLTHGTTYHIRAYATNSTGTSYGNELIFTTLKILPVVTTSEVLDVSQTTALIRSIVNSNGGSGITARGVCWGTESGPVIDGWHTENGTGEGSFDSFLTDLLPETRYFVRAYAVTEAEITYGNELDFVTAEGLGPINFNAVLTYGSVTDIEGNNYKTIRIGNQTWMAENLRTTKYNDGESITIVENPQGWSTQAAPAYAWYANTPSLYKDICGALYNWHAVSTGKLCPEGWHVPSSTEYADLMTFLGGGTDTGGKIKEAGTGHWEEPNAGATNESGWTGLPSGRINEMGSTMSYGYVGYWWTSTEFNSARANNIMLHYDFVFIDKNNYDKRNGMAVRCLKD